MTRKKELGARQAAVERNSLHPRDMSRNAGNCENGKFDEV